MTKEQAAKLAIILRNVTGVAKDSIDRFSELAESALGIFADADPNQLEAGMLPGSANHLLDKKELAARLNVSVGTIDNLISDGLEPIRINRRVLFDYDEVLRWIEAKNKKGCRKSRLRVVA